MVEINIGSDDGGGNSGGGDGPGIKSMLNQLEEMKDWAMENPEIAQMMGYDISALSDVDMDETQQGETMSVEQLMEVTAALIEAGYGDRSIQEVHTYMENNTEQVSKLIQQRT